MFERFDTMPSPPGPTLQGRQSLASECLPDDEILAFALGKLSSKRVSELHLHLDRCHLCLRLVSEAIHAVSGEPTPEAGDPDQESTFHRGEMVGGRYLIRRFIARGGMGEVYEAYDCELEERVALKTVVSTACDNPRALRRLKEEVQLARRVSHSHVCRIYDLGTHLLETTGRTVHFLTMEFVEGEPLGLRLRQSGPLEVHQANQLARQLLEGLAVAHRAGILHGDFKTDNVMLREQRDGAASAVILDFGLARWVDSEQERRASAPGREHGGTPIYMAPEQIEGRPLTIATDIYSFGLVWFEMLTGRLPFVGASTAAATLERLRRPAIPPSRLNPEVPAAIDQVVLRCLARAPEQRYESAEAVLGALDAAEQVGQKNKKRPPLHSAYVRELVMAVGLGAIMVYAGALAVARGGARPQTSTEETAPAGASARRSGAPVVRVGSGAEARYGSRPVLPPGPPGEARPASRARPILHQARSHRRLDRPTVSSQPATAEASLACASIPNPRADSQPIVALSGETESRVESAGREGQSLLSMVAATAAPAPVPQPSPASSNPVSSSPSRAIRPPPDWEYPFD